MGTFYVGEVNRLHAPPSISLYPSDFNDSGTSAYQPIEIFAGDRNLD